VTVASVQETIPVRAGEELAIPALEAFLRRAIGDLPPGDLTVRQFPAGASNLTYLLRIDGWEAVLRRPPLGPVAPRAHDVLREAALLDRLHPSYPLAPLPLTVHADPGLLGAPFFVMERRSGVALDDSLPASVTDPASYGRAVSEAFVRALVRLHAVDVAGAGLAEFGRPEGFLERQVAGWLERWERAVSEPVAGVEPLARWLHDGAPASPPPTVVHNDFKLNNLLLDAAGAARVTAVVDWEMTTVGDPLFDLGVALGYWVQADDPAELRRLVPAVTSLPGFHSRAEMAAAYTAASGRDTGELPWYLAFAYFKLAVILQQIHARWARGQTRDPRFAGFAAHARLLIAHALDRVERDLPV
jgi:aminoglycoside phosphotransferase (APT) family kinase protein